MRALLQLFLRNGGFFIFAVLELVCFYLIVNFNPDQEKIYAHTATLVGGNMNKRWRNMIDYYHLPDRLREVSAENDSLKTILLRMRTVQVPYRDTFFTVSYDTLRKKMYRPDFEFIAAQVIGNNIGGSSNWITLNRGKSDGITENSGVVTRNGLVGIVRFADNNFSMVMSLLHRQTKISASLKNRGFFGSLVWDGNDPGVMTLNDIPKHVPIQPGDTVITSGYSLLFPRDYPIGAIESYDTPSGSNFYSIRVRLSQNMADVRDVYVVKNIFYTQIDSLQRRAKDEQ
ncbi:MAG: rod shape-determining protein MreC [Saprospiraceae bacterium]|nr:rod shape-determining protein MreC [Saprospiraceae bacterium]